MTVKLTMNEEAIYKRHLKTAQNGEGFADLLEKLDTEVAAKYAGVGCEVQLVTPREKTAIWGQLIVRRYMDFGFYVNISPQTKLEDADQATYDYNRLILTNAQLPK